MDTPQLIERLYDLADSLTENKIDKFNAACFLRNTALRIEATATPETPILSASDYTSRQALRQGLWAAAFKAQSDKEARHGYAFTTPAQAGDQALHDFDERFPGSGTKS